MVSLRALCKFPDAPRVFPVVSIWNITTRDRHIEHERPKILCFGAVFPLDINFAFVYIAPLDSGDRDFGARTAHPPREGRNTVSRNLPGTIETSKKENRFP